MKKNVEMIKVESTNIESIGHKYHTLYVTFQSGATYKYLHVKKQTFLEMLGVRSKGHYLNTIIKPNYPFKKI